MLERLREIRFWTNVGNPNPFGLPRVAHWEEALNPGRRDRWEDVGLEAANRVGDAVQNSSMPDYERWNDIVLAAKPEVERIAGPAQYVVEEPLRLHLRHAVRWDLLHAVVEHEYRDFGVGSFYRDLVVIYEAGHFPCSWEGDFPEGRVVLL